MPALTPGLTVSLQARQTDCVHAVGRPCDQLHRMQAGAARKVPYRMAPNKTGILTVADAVWGCYLSPGTTMVCEPRIFAEIGLFDTKLQRHEHWDWLLRLTARYDLAYLSEPLAGRESFGVWKIMVRLSTQSKVFAGNTFLSWAAFEAPP
jgi:hypothetical protein